MRRFSCEFGPLALHKVLVVVVRGVGVVVHGLLEAIVDGRAEHVIEAGMARLFVDGRYLHLVSIALHGLIGLDDVTLIDFVGELLSCLSHRVGLVA